MTKKMSKAALLFFAGAMALTSCNRETDLYNPYATMEDYSNNWNDKFGNVDENQDWNMAVCNSINVVVDGTAKASIYSKGTETSRLLAEATISGSQIMKFDATEDLKEVYVVINSTERLVQVVQLGENATADFTQTSQAKARMTRAGETIADREYVYALNYNLFPGDEKDQYGNDVFTNMNLTQNVHNYYKSWNSEVYTTVNFASTSTVGADADMASLEDVVSGCANIYIENDDDITKLYPFTKDLKIVTSKAEPITITGIYRNTAGYTSLAYFYAPENASIEDLKAADKYILIPNTNEIVGKTYNLIYYDPANNYKPTYTFPAGLEIHFALVCNPAISRKWYSWSEETGDILANAMDGSLWEFSNAEMNNDVYTLYKGWTNMSAAALYSYHGVNIMSFEDWGGNFSEVDGIPTPSTQNNSVDWNDIAFAINMEMKTPPAPVVPEEEQGESWIVACEDLGSTDDYDFNDIVFSVSHVGGSKTATVTPLAAGGTIPAYIYYDSKNLGEIHQLIKDGANTSEMLNTTSKGSAGKPFTVDVPEDFTMSESMGGFSIMVQSDNAITITSPALGTAPQMICMPGSWAWPKERVGIEVAYPSFSNWSQNSQSNLDWYKSPVSEYIVK